MVSRRKILSRSRDDLSAEQPYMPEDEEDVWYQKDKLFKVSICIVNQFICYTSSKVIIDVWETVINHPQPLTFQWN